MRDIQPGDTVKVVDGNDAARQATWTVVEFDGLHADLEATVAGNHKGVWRFHHDRIVRVWPPPAIGREETAALREWRDQTVADVALVAELRATAEAFTGVCGRVLARFAGEEGQPGAPLAASHEAVSAVAQQVAETVAGFRSELSAVTPSDDFGM